uniref:Uncharacterized protein n=1 Tax=Arundo donax TaxID=35708 RepID=A0A0A9E479_ARUDO
MMGSWIQVRDPWTMKSMLDRIHISWERTVGIMAHGLWHLEWGLLVPINSVIHHWMRCHHR